MRGLGGAAAAALLAMTASGCWLQAGYGAGKGGWNDREDTVLPHTVAGLEEAWSATVPGAGPGREPLVSGDTVVVRSAEAVTALDLATGAQRWSTGIGGNDAAAIVEGALRVPSDGPVCAVVSFDLADGTRLGQRNYGFYGFFPPSAPQTSTACTTSDALGLGSRVVLTAASYTTTIAPRCGFVSASSSGISYLDFGAQPADGDSGGNAVGQCGGSAPPPPPPPPVPSEPATEAGDVVLRPSSAQGTLVAYPKVCSPTCQPVWTADTDATFVGPVVGLLDGDAAVAGGDGTVLVIDGSTHALGWTGTAGAGGLVDQPVAADDRYLFATTDGTVAAYPAGGCAAATCDPLWSASVGAPVAAPPVISDGTLLVTATDGSLTAFTLR